ncbi:MAG: Gfo/Idh/MocA family protein [Pirellulaceae bacterium]
MAARILTSPFNRRQFIQSLGVTAAVGPQLHAASRLPASRQVRLGLIGCGGRGRELLEVFREFPDIDVPVVSDVNEPRMNQAAAVLAEGPIPRQCEQVVDYHRILERNDIDAVLIATTQHWHGLPFIHAAQAGKHIYVEKPLSHTVAEGRAMVDAARQSGVIAVMGTQQRNYAHYQQAQEILRSGRLGDIALVECWNYENLGKRVGHHRDADPPQGLHWDLWLGPAPYVPYNPGRMNNSWWYDYAGGMLTNWAVHHIDIVLWAMQATWPTEVACLGGKLVVDDMADTPDTVEASWRFPDFVLRYSYRGFNNFHVVQSRPAHHGICFHGNQATLVLDRSGFEIWEDRNPNASAQKVANPRFWRDGKPGNEVDGPWQRLFVDCIQNGTKPPLDLEESHRATACCHLANIAYLTGGSFTWDGMKESIPADPAAAALLARPRRAGYALP